MIKHKHHIIPRHAGGTDDPSNIVELTIEDHAEAHRVLWVTHGRAEDKLAWQALSGMLGRQEIITELCRIAGKKGGALGGRAGKGRKQSGEHINNRKMFAERNGMYGKHHTEEHKKLVGEKIKQHIDENWVGTKNLKDSIKSRMESGSHPSLQHWTCEHCGKSGKATGNYHRYHGINCKAYTLPTTSSLYSSHESSTQ